MTFVPALTSFALVVLAARLRCGALAARLVLGATLALVAGFQVAFCAMCAHAFPYNSWAWSLVAAGGLTWIPSVRARARNHGALLLAEAEEGVLGALDADGDYVIDGVEQKDAAAALASADARARGLAKWIGAALGGEGGARAGERHAEHDRGLARALLDAGLTRERLVDAARLPGGFQVLCGLLEAEQSGLGLRAGDRLALAAAAMRAASEEQASPEAADVRGTPGR